MLGGGIGCSGQLPQYCRLYFWYLGLGLGLLDQWRLKIQVKVELEVTKEIAVLWRLVLGQLAQHEGGEALLVLYRLAEDFVQLQSVIILGLRPGNSWVYSALVWFSAWSPVTHDRHLTFWLWSLDL